MKNWKLMIMAIILPIAFMSCGSDDDNTPSGPGVPGGDSDIETATYELYIDGTKVKSGTTKEIGMLPGEGGVFTDPITVSEGDEISILISGVPADGATSVIEGSMTTVVITGNIINNSESENTLMAISGTIKRSSSSKIEFEGKATKFPSMTTHSFTGFVKSDAFKKLTIQ